MYSTLSEIFVTEAINQSRRFFFLMSLRDFRPVLGNHDAWLEEYLCTGIPDPSWTRKNGGDITCRAMRKLSRKNREMLRLWLRTFPIFRIENDLIIVHGGFPSEYTEKELIELSKVSRPSPLSAIYSEAYEDENHDWIRDGMGQGLSLLSNS